MAEIVTVRDLTKAYGDVRAVDGISFSVNRGEVFGLVGPNGAGKTTTWEILEGLRRADRGEVNVAGFDLRKDRRKLRERIGVQLQATALFERLTARETLDVFGSMYPRSLPADDLLALVNLEEKADDWTEKLSGGQKQRLAVALALVNDPEIVFLDEPTTGLDPQARRSLWDVIEKLRDTGKTIMLTTHYMEEAERLCQRVGVMDHGKILALDEPEKLILNLEQRDAATAGDPLQLQQRAVLADDDAVGGGALEALADVLGALDPQQFDGLVVLALGLGERLLAVHHAGAGGVTETLDVEDGRVTLYTRHLETTLAAVFAHARERGISIEDFHVRNASLEDVFLQLTGRRIRE